MMNDLNRNGITVLVVEDYKFTQDLIVSILERQGYIVIGKANNGKKALELYNDLSPDVVTMDMNMPGMNGLQTIQALIAMDPDAKILAITGYRDIEKKTKELGARGFLAKPFQPKQLFEAIEQVLNSSMVVDTPDWSEPAPLMEPIEPVIDEEDINPELSEESAEDVPETDPWKFFNAPVATPVEEQDSSLEPVIEPEELPNPPAGEVIIISSEDDEDEEDDLLSSLLSARRTQLYTPIISETVPTLQEDEDIVDEISEFKPLIPEIEREIEEIHPEENDDDFQEETNDEPIESIVEEAPEKTFEDTDDEDFIMILNHPVAYENVSHETIEAVKAVPDVRDNIEIRPVYTDEPLIIKPPIQMNPSETQKEAGTSIKPIEDSVEPKKKKFSLFSLFRKNKKVKKERKDKNEK